MQEEYERKIAELHIRKKEIRKALDKESAIEKSPQHLLDFYEVEREIEGYQKKLRKSEVQRRVEAGKSLNLGIEICRKHRWVRLRGLYASQIKPHQDHIESYRDDFAIVRDADDPYHQDKTNEYSLTLWFGNDVGLIRYLEFFGWQHLPDTC